MRRRQFIIVMGCMAAELLLPLPIARAQEPGRIYRLGTMTGAARAAPRMAAFFDELKVFGFVDGQNLDVVAGGFDLQDDQFAEVAARLCQGCPRRCFLRQ